MNLRLYTPNYEDYVEKFKVKRTTDDTFTPPEVYETVAQWVLDRYSIGDDVEIVRPFYPGGDYQSFDYPEGCLVLDNPPFSIHAQILRWYEQRGIKYFLFAPHLTLMAAKRGASPRNYVVCGVPIRYENGAKVSTSFITNLGENVIETCPDLYSMLEELQSGARRKMARYVYPDEVFTSNMGQKLNRRGVRFTVRAGAAVQISQLDAQRESKAKLFGRGMLISSGKAAECRALLDSRQPLDSSESVVRWELSDDEAALVGELDESEQSAARAA